MHNNDLDFISDKDKNPEKSWREKSATQLWFDYKQDGRLAPAYFSQEYKYFDQHLPTVKKETTV